VEKHDNETRLQLIIRRHEALQRRKRNKEKQVDWMLNHSFNETEIAAELKENMADPLPIVR
jgi:hypothetical protein